MAESNSVIAEVTSLPSTDEIERAVTFTREPFLIAGEEAEVALAPGTARRTALDAALEEIAAGEGKPSIAWRRKFSLLLGLDRLLSQDEPTLVDGTVLSAHQVDALSGTLTALLAEAQRNGNGGAASIDAVEDLELVSSAIPGEEDLEEEEPEEEPQDWSDEEQGEEEELVDQAAEDPNAAKRFWFEHATGAGKTVAALGFVEASRTGGTLILTHRRNLVEQFLGELQTRGYKKRISPPILKGGPDRADGAVTVETYQWFVRNAGKISDSYTIVICDEAHTALGEKTSSAIRAWAGPVFIGMTATGALIARHVTDLFPTQTSRFDLAQAARRGVISPLRCVRIPPGPGVRTIAKVPLRRGEVDTEFDQEMLAELLDQQPFNMAVADLYKTRFKNIPGVVYTAGVQHAQNVAKAFQLVGLKARAVSGETPKRALAQILAAYERGTIDVLVNAMLLAEGWNSPRATVCMHLAPTASRRVYQQRVGRVTRRQLGKEAGIVVDFVHPATKNDDPVVTLHSLLNRDVYRGGAIVVGPVRRGRGRRLRVERRVVPVTSDENRRIEVFERELWRIAVEHLDYGEQVQWAALAGARVIPNGWRRARAILHFDRGGELKRTFLLTTVQRNKHSALRLRALQEIANLRDVEAFDDALEMVGTWPRDERREGVGIILQALAEKPIGAREQANNWIWRCAEFTREAHEEYAAQRWPETKRLLGLLVNSVGAAHARNARRLVQAAREQDHRLAAALLAAAVVHTAEAGEVINGARTRMSRKPSALARELFRNIPRGKSGRRNSRKRRKKGTPAQPSVRTESREVNGSSSGRAGRVNLDPEHSARVKGRSVDGHSSDAESQTTIETGVNNKTQTTGNTAGEHNLRHQGASNAGEKEGKATSSKRVAGLKIRRDPERSSEVDEVPVKRPVRRTKRLGENRTNKTQSGTPLATTGVDEVLAETTATAVKVAPRPRRVSGSSSSKRTEAKDRSTESDSSSPKKSSTKVSSTVSDVETPKKRGLKAAGVKSSTKANSKAGSIETPKKASSKSVGVKSAKKTDLKAAATAADSKKKTSKKANPNAAVAESGEKKVEKKTAVKKTTPVKRSSSKTVKTTVKTKET